MTLKELLDEVLLTSGVSTYSSYAGSDDDEVKRMVALANQSITELSRYPYQSLRDTFEFTLSTDTDYSLPSDWRAFVPDTFFTDSRYDAVDFPTSAEYWGMLQATTGGTGVSVRARILGDRIQIYQPDSGETLRIEYISKHPVKNAAGTAQARFTADTDYPRIDDHLVQLDITWRYKKLMGLEDWTIDLATFKAYEKTLRGQEQGAKTLRPLGEVPSGPYYNLWRPVPNSP